MVPEEDIEEISGHVQQIAAVLRSVSQTQSSLLRIFQFALVTIRNKK